jgi:hypothetical protein
MRSNLLGVLRYPIGQISDLREWFFHSRTGVGVRNSSGVVVKYFWSGFGRRLFIVCNLHYPCIHISIVHPPIGVYMVIY